MDPTLARKYAKVYGAVSGAIEYVQYLMYLKGLKGGTPAASKFFNSIMSSKLGMGLGITAEMVFEGGEEWSQNALQNVLMARAVAEHNKKPGATQLTPPEWGEGGMEAFALGAVLGGGYKGTGSLARATKHMGNMLTRKGRQRNLLANIDKAKEADLDNPKAGTAITVGEDKLLILDVTKDGTVRVQGGVLGKIVREMEP